MNHKGTSGHHEKVPSTLAGLLVSRREALGLTRTQMAMELGISRSYMTRLETGEHKHPSLSLLAKIVKRSGVSPEDLYALTGYILPTDLPSFSAYLRAMHPDWPDSAITQLDNFHDLLADILQQGLRNT